MLNFWVTNLLIPSDPLNVPITTPHGVWQFVQLPQFQQNKAAITGTTTPRPQILPIAETYYLQDVQGANDAIQRLYQEVTPILLGATYATGMSVTSQRATKDGGPFLIKPSEDWPRARAVDRPSYVVNTADEFRHLVEAFVEAWPTAGNTEKALLLVHHWLDSLSCWSMEDLYLSATTGLQIVAATEETKQGKELSFYKGIEGAATRMGIGQLSPQFKDMRNDLVHDGRLIGSRFRGPDKMACAKVIAEVLNWLDTYVHAALALGPVTKQRFQVSDFVALNAYSI